MSGYCLIFDETQVASIPKHHNSCLCLQTNQRAQDVPLPACASLELEFNMVATIDQGVACDDQVLFQMHLIS